jgi:hypothetical protein
MEACVEKAEEAEHSAESDQLWQAEDLAERTDCQSKDQEIERPISCEASGHLHEVHALSYIPSFPSQMRHGSKRQPKD